MNLTVALIIGTISTLFSYAVLALYTTLMDHLWINNDTP